MQWLQICLEYSIIPVPVIFVSKLVLDAVIFVRPNELNFNQGMMLCCQWLGAKLITLLGAAQLLELIPKLRCSQQGHYTGQFSHVLSCELQVQSNKADNLLSCLFDETISYVDRINTFWWRDAPLEC